MRGNCAALREVNLELAAGEHVCILGPNGCGKSTLIKTITRECYPLARDRCSISILGHERWNIFELRSLLGIVSPDLLVSCTTEATGKDVVLSGFFSSTRILPHHHPEPELLGAPEGFRLRMVMRQNARAAEKSGEHHILPGGLGGARHQQVRRHNSQQRTQLKNVPPFVP